MRTFSHILMPQLIPLPALAQCRHKIRQYFNNLKMKSKTTMNGFYQSDSQSPTDSESTLSQNIGNARTKCLYVHKMPIRSRLLDGHSILYSNSRTRCKYVAVFLRPVNAVLIMLLITYFTTDRVLLSTFLL